MKEKAMRKSYKGLAAGVVAGLGLLFLGALPASADSLPQSASSSAYGNGVIAGNSVAANVAVPIDIECNGTGAGVVGVGIGSSHCTPRHDVVAQHAQSHAAGNGLGTGNSIALNAAAPIKVLCNLTGIGGVGLGVGSSSC
jgi:hypothetical protein